MLKEVEPACPPARLLDALTPLGEDDKAAIARLVLEGRREVSPRRDIVREGDRPASVLFVLQGWGCRYKQLADGRRQVVGILLPGDMCDMDTALLDRMDHSIGAVSRMKIAEASFDRVARLRDQHPALARAMARHELVKIATQREWTTSLGQRSAIERIAHLCCEIFFRLRSIGQVEGSSCEFPLTQTDLADACGLTPVHVNRTIQDMRREALIALGGRQLVIPNLEALMDRALFDPSYLHLGSRKGPPVRG